MPAGGGPGPGHTAAPDSAAGADLRAGALGQGGGFGSRGVGGGRGLQTPGEAAGGQPPAAGHLRPELACVRVRAQTSASEARAAFRPPRARAPAPRAAPQPPQPHAPGHAEPPDCGARRARAGRGRAAGCAPIGQGRRAGAGLGAKAGERASAGQTRTPGRTARRGPRARARGGRRSPGTARGGRRSGRFPEAPRARPAGGGGVHLWGGGGRAESSPPREGAGRRRAKANLGRRSRPPPTHARGAERPAPPSAAGVASRGELRRCGLARRPERPPGSGRPGQAHAPGPRTHPQSLAEDTPEPRVSRGSSLIPSRPEPARPPGSLRRGPSPQRPPSIARLQASGHLAQQEAPGSGQGRAGSGEPEPAQRPNPADPSEPTHGAPAPRAPSPGRAAPGTPSRAEEEPRSVTREPRQPQGGSAAAGTAGGSPRLQALPGSPPRRAKGLARQPRAMMKTLSSGNCALSVPAKNSYRMVVLGASRVGKSSIVSRFLNGRFEDQYTPTIEDFHRKVYNIRGDMYQLDILDTSGNHPFPAMRRLSILTGDVFILVFSLDSRESFDEVKRLQKQILEVKSCLKNKTKEAAELPMVICGNKNDHGELCRQVPSTEAELLVSGDENCAYFEVSAKRNTNVDEMFYVLFSMAKLPHEMSPALHRKISVQYGDAFHPRPFCMRRVKDMDAYGMVSPFARRPSVNSDLKYIKAKVLREGQARERDKCTIQ